MLFNSFHFALFFPVAAAGYFLLPARFRWAWLLAASYYFYMAWNPAYVVLLLGATLVNYSAALALEHTAHPRLRTFYLAITLVMSLGLLFFFKYYGLFFRSTSVLLGFAGLENRLPVLHLLLPVGISFYTFQALSYTLDVYWGRQQAERHPGIFALYVSFFPNSSRAPSNAPAICCRNSASATPSTMTAYRAGFNSCCGASSKR